MLYAAYVNCANYGFFFVVKSNDRRNYLKASLLVESQITFITEVS